MMTLSHLQPITVLLDKHAHHYAQLFASEQVNPQKGKQVYLNTLAVYAVHHYCQWLSIPHSIQQGDCWQPGLRAIFDVADLVLPKIGKLECRPLLPSQQALVIPLEVSCDRIGYIAVQFRENLDQVQLLGFISATEISDPLQPIALTQLQPLDCLIDTIECYQFSVNLRQWFEDIFTPEWQSVSSFLATTGRITRSLNSSNSGNHTISRAKIISWDNTEVTLILVVKIRERSPQEVDISLQIYPDKQNNHLPPQLEITVFDQAGTPALEAKTQKEDNWIQLDFTCHPPEQFSVTMTIDSNSITELFDV